MEWALFFLSAAIIIASGAGLALCADVVAERTGLGALWFGAVVVAMITSLPELATGISAVRMDAPALALGDLFGANMANMAILALVTLAFPRRRVLQRAALEHALTAALAVAMTSLALITIQGQAAFTQAGVNTGPWLIGGAFLAGSYLVRERQAAAAAHERDDYGFRPSFRVAVPGMLVTGAAIVASGPVLAHSAEELAEATGVGQSFFGSFALALVTTLPELSVSIAAVRIGAYNLAVANLLGSNAMNMALLLPLEIASLPGSIASAAGPDLQVAAGGGILMMATGTAAIVLKAERQRIPLDIAAVFMLVTYAGCLWTIYDLRPH